MKSKEELYKKITTEELEDIQIPTELKKRDAKIHNAIVTATFDRKTEPAAEALTKNLSNAKCCSQIICLYASAHAKHNSCS